MKQRALIRVCRGREIEHQGAASGTSHHPGGHCHEPGCLGRTRGEKPYCTDHVFRMDYAANVLTEWRQACEAQRTESRLDRRISGSLFSRPTRT